MSPSDPKRHLPLKLQLHKNPLSHKPTASDSYSFIHSPLIPVLVLIFPWKHTAAAAVSVVDVPICLSSSAVMSVDMPHSELNDYKGKRVCLMETCLPSPVGDPASTVSSWG